MCFPLLSGVTLEGMMQFAQRRSQECLTEHYMWHFVSLLLMQGRVSDIILVKPDVCLQDELDDIDDKYMALGCFYESANIF